MPPLEKTPGKEILYDHPEEVRYFIPAAMFVLLTVALIFLFPYAVNLSELGWKGFIPVGIYLSVLLFGYLFFLKKSHLYDTHDPDF